MISETAFLYFFSAAFQGLAAILGLLGVFAIFRLQQLGASIDGVRNELFSDRGHSTWPAEIEKFERMSHQEKIARVATLEKQSHESTILPLFRSWLEAEKSILKLRAEIWRPIALLAFVTIGNIIILPFSGHIAPLDPWGKWIVVFIDLGFISWSIVWNLLSIKRLVDSLVK